MPQPLLLEGQYEPEQDSVEKQLLDLSSRFAEFTVQAVGKISDLQNRLARIEHGMAIAAGDVVPESVPYAPEVNSKWDFWKKRYPGRVAEAIDLLLHQQEMNATQMCSALRCDPRTLSAKVIFPLNKAGLINKNGGKFSLKEL